MTQAMPLRVALWAARLPLWLAMASLAVMALLTFVDVIMRSLANAPVPAAAELTEVLLAATVFAALPATALGGKHISVDLLDSLMSPRIVIWRNAVVEILFGCLLFWPVAKVWEGVIRTFGYGEVTLYLRIPLGWVLTLIAVGFAVSAVAMIFRGLVLLIRGDAVELEI